MFSPFRQKCRHLVIVILSLKLYTYIDHEVIGQIILFKYVSIIYLNLHIDQSLYRPLILILTLKTTNNYTSYSRYWLSYSKL